MSDLSKDCTFQEQLRRLRRTDNLTNFLFIGRAWLIIAFAAGIFVAFDLYRSAAGWHWTWDLPLFLLTAVVVGASQHQLAGAGHEATHHMLFKDRLLNEIVSDWFCMFPILTTTSTYRSQHLAHHQHVNDPEEDPDLLQLQSSGHDFAFPMAPGKLPALFFRQLWPPNLVRYTLHRVRYSAIGVTGERPAGAIPDRLFFLYFFGFFGLMGLLAHLEMAPWTIYLAAGSMTAIAAFVIRLTTPPGVHRTGSVYPARVGQFLRYAHITLMLLGATLIHVHTGLETLAYLAVLWFVPLATVFSFFMMLRQTIQHGNCDEGKFTNTRVFLVNPLCRYAIFPFGMDYHLPHHLFATVPHYRLATLHALLEDTPDYHWDGQTTRGCFPSAAEKAPSSLPTICDALGPDYAPTDSPSPGPAR